MANKTQNFYSSESCIVLRMVSRMEPNGQTWVIMFCENYKCTILIPCERNLEDNSSECFGILQKSQQPRFWSNYFLSFQGWHFEILMHRYTSQTWPGRLIIKNDIYLNSCIEQCTVCLIWSYSSTIWLPLEYFYLCIVFVSMYSYLCVVHCVLSDHIPLLSGFRLTHFNILCLRAGGHPAG